MCRALCWEACSMSEVAVSSSDCTEASENQLYSLSIFYPPSIQLILMSTYHASDTVLGIKDVMKDSDPWEVWDLQGKQLSTEREHSCWGESSGRSYQTGTGLARTPYQRKGKLSTCKQQK